MLTRNTQRIALGVMLLLLCFVLIFDFSSEYLTLREGIESAQDREERCQSEADNWVVSTDFGTNEKTQLNVYKEIFKKQCNEAGRGKLMVETQGPASEALYNNKYANELLEINKRTAIQQINQNLVNLGFGINDLATSTKPEAVAVRNYADALKYIELAEKNKSSAPAKLPAASVPKPSTDSASKSAPSLGLGF